VAIPPSRATPEASFQVVSPGPESQSTWQATLPDEIGRRRVAGVVKGKPWGVSERTAPCSTTPDGTGTGVATELITMLVGLVNAPGGIVSVAAPSRTTPPASPMDPEPDGCAESMSDPWQPARSRIDMGKAVLIPVAPDEKHTVDRGRVTFLKGRLPG
jgi:hypothetical protein